MGVQVKRMTNRDREFYPTMGPFLARRDIERELGGRIYDDDDRVWYVAMSRGRVTGFCSARQTKTGAVYLSDYVLPAHRRRGVYRALWDMRAGEFPGDATAVCTAASLPMFQKGGFTVARMKGKFHVVSREGS
jgi:GNAT superfamily N-acetyltransferase